MLSSFLDLLFPITCNYCGGALERGEKYICSACLSDLPCTNFHQYSEDNMASRRLWGKLPLRDAYSYLYFVKGLHVQHLMHNIKYKNQYDTAAFLGRMHGIQMRGHWDKYDLIIPVPMHPYKLLKRGYNPAYHYGKGLEEVSSIPVCDNVLVRGKRGTSQTRLNRWKRWVNAEEVYALDEPEMVYGKNILLVDDVLTTGATLEVCGNKLIQGGARAIGISTLCIAV